MIGNAHIDPVWLWQWQEGFHEVKATFRSALDRMNEYDDFIFTSSSAAYYEWVEKSDPEMFAEIQERVRQGRWFIAGGWWIQPDCNIPGGESFVRQALYGQRYFKEKLGVTARVGYNVDSFGHQGMLPQILKKSGLDYYIFLRPGPHEKGLPSRLFWWESDDCSRVLAYRIPFEYGTWGNDLESHIKRCAAELRAPINESLCFYGVGNHGGGPTIENLESIHRLNGDKELPDLVFSTPLPLFEHAIQQGWPIPVVHDDLQHHASGCYSAHSAIKRWNRKAENLLINAEKWSAIAAWTTGHPYPVDLTQAWKNVLFNQFHDIMAGTCIEEAYEDARDQYGEAMSIASRGLNFATQSITWKIRIPPEVGMIPFVVFNPHAWATKVSVELECTPLFGKILLDDSGKPVPMQEEQAHASALGRNRFAFIAELPPLGYRTYRLVQADLHPEELAQLERIQARKQLNAGDTMMENGRYRLEFNIETGAITSLFDKDSNCEVFAGPAAVPVVYEDSSDTWSHNVFQYNQVAGYFRAKSVKLIENGPVKSVVRVTSEYGGSILVQDFILYWDLDVIDVRAAVDWHEKHKVLKLRFPVNISHMQAVNEIPYGHIERFANGEENPMQSWIDLSGISRQTSAPYGFSLLNDCKYSCDVNVREIGMTVLRSPIYAHHMPLEPDPNGQYTYIDQGLQHFQYTLYPHRAGWEQAGTVRRAAELNQPPTTLIETYHPDGTLPQSDSFFSIDCDNILVSVIKKAEDSEDLIARCIETSKEAVHATICMPGWNRAFEVDFSPCEIKTFRIPKDRQEMVVETDLLELKETGIISQPVMAGSNKMILYD